MRSDSGKSLVPNVPSSGAAKVNISEAAGRAEICNVLSGKQFTVCGGNGRGTPGRLHISSPARAVFNLLLSSCRGKPLLCKVQTALTYMRPHVAGTPTRAKPIYLPIRAFIHPSYSDPPPSHNEPALKGKAESFISINRSPLHYHRHHLWTSCIKLDGIYVYSRLPLTPIAG